MRKEAVMRDIDFKELSKNCKSIDDINKLTRKANEKRSGNEKYRF